MRGINKVILVGRATRDPERRTTAGGTAVANLRVATNRVTRGADGELNEVPQFHTVVCWDRLAEQTGRHVHKGRLLYIEGRLEGRSFTDSAGAERHVTEVIASDVQFLDAPGAASTDLPSEDGDQTVNPDDIPF